MNKPPMRAIGAVLAIVFIAGCSSDDGSENFKGDTKLDMREAAGKADDLIYRTLSAVKPPLEWTHDTSDHGACDGSNGASGYGDVTRRAVVMTEVSEARRGALLGVIERYWKEAGHKITDVNSNKEFPEVFAETRDGLLRMSLVVGGKGQFFLDVQTACVKEAQVTAPSTEVNGTSYYGKAIPRPNVRSDFWSLGRPVSSNPPSGT
ncbi:hypothetical protein [Streptomyces sp. NPDC058371]|uniref:hypothetical protein n=1 Tax=Streptomyces sp. NPDC058371 TaxID=3346463 RepID=UPI0036503E75